MASKRKTLVATSAVLVVAATGYYLYSAFAVQGQGELAQAPLNIQSSVKPAFIMGVDNSGSMTDQMLMRTSEGNARWGGTPASLFNDDGTPRESGTAYNAVFGGPENQNLAPPLDVFGATRSPQYNRSYFDPGVTYHPWQKADETFEADAKIAAVDLDPKNPGVWTMNVSDMHKDRLDDAAGTFQIDNWDIVSGDGIAKGMSYKIEKTGTCGGIPRTSNNWKVAPVDYIATGTCDNVDIRIPQPDNAPAASERFTVPNGVTVPAGTTVFVTGVRGCGGLGTDIASRNAWVALTADVKLSAQCDVGIEFYPATFYLKSTTPAPAGWIGKATVTTGACGPGCDLAKYEIRSANYSGSPEGSTKTYYDLAIQNFANWWSYYGNRNRAMIAGMTQSMASIKNMRVGYFQINPAPPSGDVTMYNMEKSAQKEELYKLMRGLNASGNTPTRRAVDYMVKQFRREGDGAPVELVCQKNAGMLFTDGFTNDSNEGMGTVGDVDGALPAPFGGGVASSDTIADFAMDGYLNNLRPLMAKGKVPVPSACKLPNGDINPKADPRLDCQPNLHMNFYGITLGARGNIYDVDAEATKDPYNNSPKWGAKGLPNYDKTTTDLSPAAVDDIWHAAINTRGEFINAQSPAAITDAMRRILQQIGEGATPSGSIALTGSRVGAGSLTVTPFYESTNNGTDWYSTLTGTEVSNNPKTGAVVYTGKWEASKNLPATRNIWFASTTTGVKPTVASFTAASLGDKPFKALCSDDLSRCDEAKVASKLPTLTADAAIAYLRGDQSQETKKTGGILRDRTTVLGDIVNSSPVISSPKMDDYGYLNLRGTTAADYNPYNYDDYLEKKKDRDAMVYVGANDGMLHAFNGKDGVEQFAYIPATSVSHMGNLLFPYVISDKDQQVFSHRYYVDGLITVSDAYYSGGWETVLVGASGAGGRSVFALNVSKPSDFSNESVLWEINDKISDTTIADNIGYVLGKPLILPVKTSAGVEWKAVFGNGYGSKNGKAVLFVVDIGTGKTEYVQAQETGVDAPTTSNGLGNIIAIDRWMGTTDQQGRDGYADTVYGGDQNGAVWKFDLRTAKPTVGVGGKPLFIAQNADDVRQPIIGGFEAAAGPAGGVMLYFGTGSFSFASDPADETMQSVYGVLDNFADKPVAGRSELLKQEILLDGKGVRTTTNNVGLGKLGWYMDLGVSGTSGSPAATGERFVGNPVIASGVVFFPTYNPDSTADCKSAGNNWLYGLNALTGGAGLSGVRVKTPDGTPYGSGTGAVQLETNGTAPVKDVAVLTSPKQGILPLDAEDEDVNKALSAQCTMAVQAPGAETLYLPRPCGRQSWRQIL